MLVLFVVVVVNVSCCVMFLDNLFGSFCDVFWRLIVLSFVVVVFLFVLGLVLRSY